MTEIAGPIIIETGIIEKRINKKLFFRSILGILKNNTQIIFSSQGNFLIVLIYLGALAFLVLLPLFDVYAP